MADAEGNRVLDAKINGSKALFNDPLLAIEGEGRTRGRGEGGREIIYRMCKPQRVGGLREGRSREGEGGGGGRGAGWERRQKRKEGGRDVGRRSWGE